MTSERTHSRRSILAGIGGGVAGAAAMAPSVQAEQVIEDQFLVDTDSADSSGWRESVEVVDEAPQTGFASVKGKAETLEKAGLRFAKEIELQIAPPGTPDGAPASTTDSDVDISPGNHTSVSGSPEPHPFQWDKRAQAVGELHGQGITGSGATIAIVDSGIDADHPDLEVNTKLSENFSAADSIGPVPSEYHGTHVAGIAAATGNSAAPGEPYVVGVAPDAELLDMKTFPFLSGASFLRAIETAALRGADVINMSFGPGAPYGPSIASDLNKEAYQQVAAFARGEGALLVESAGNLDVNIDAVDELTTNVGKDTPPNYLRVSATGPVTTAPFPPFGDVAPTDLPAYYTSYGPDAVDVSAPGGNVVSTDFDGVLSTMPAGVPGGFIRVGENDLYGTLQGTSMAAPNAAGLAALVKSQNPRATPEQLKTHLKNTARTIDTEYPDVFDLFEINIGYFENVSPGLFSDFELDDPYSSETYRGAGHIDITRAATKEVAFAGGINIRGRTIFPSDPDNDGLYEDVNGDGAVDMDDVRTLYQIALRGVPNDANEAFDFNRDGQFDMRDVQAFIRQL